MTDDELLSAMHLAYHQAWDGADRRRNVTRQVMAPLLALVREHDRDECVPLNQNWQLQLEAARREAHEAGLREGKVEGLRGAAAEAWRHAEGFAESDENEEAEAAGAESTAMAIERLIAALSTPPAALPKEDDRG